MTARLAAAEANYERASLRAQLAIGTVAYWKMHLRTREEAAFRELVAAQREAGVCGVQTIEDVFERLPGAARVRHGDADA